MNTDTLIRVTNRYNGSVGYKIPDLQIRRHFEPGEMKMLTFEELQKLSYQPGGEYILKSYFLIDNQEAVAELLGEVEPEYYYTKEDVEKLLLTGSLDQLKDCLDFADDGVISLVKDLAVKLEINDMSKREAIKEKTLFDVTKAIEINKETEEEEDKPAPTKRRAAPVSTEETNQTKRRTTPPKYRVVTQQ